MGWFTDILGTLANTFRVGGATLDASSVTARRTVALPDASGTLALTGGNAALAATDGSFTKLTVANTGTADAPLFGNVATQQFTERTGAPCFFVLNGSATGLIGGLFEGCFTGTADSSSTVNGINAFATTKSTSTGNLTASAGGGGLRNRYAAHHYGSGTVARASGVSAVVSVFGGGVTNAAAFNAESPSLTSGRTIGSYAGLWVQGGSSAGTVTTRYGVRVDTLTGGATRYGLYVQSDQTYLGGPLRLANVPVYESQAEAAAGGLGAGDVFRTAAGALMIKT